LFVYEALTAPCAGGKGGRNIGECDREWRCKKQGRCKRDWPTPLGAGMGADVMKKKKGKSVGGGFERRFMGRGAV